VLKTSYEPSYADCPTSSTKARDGPFEALRKPRARFTTSDNARTCQRNLALENQVRPSNGPVLSTKLSVSRPNALNIVTKTFDIGVFSLKCRN